MFQPSDSETANIIKSLLAGAVAGAVSRTITSPLERLKVLQQVSMHLSHEGTGRPRAMSNLQLLRKMWLQEGVLSYWKGNGTNVLRIAPYSAIQFFSNDYYKRLFMKEHDHRTHMLLLCGGLAGMTSSIMCYPLDLVRAILTVQTTKKHYNGMGDALSRIYSKEGVRGLYKGLIPSLMGIAPYVAINFAAFDFFKEIYLPSRSSPYFDLINLLCGAAAGACAATVTYPSDVIRRKLQLSGVEGIDLPKYKGIWDCCTQIAAKEGAVGFYRGLIACYLKVVPAMSIAFMTYENLRVKVLKFEIKSKGAVRISVGS